MTQEVKQTDAAGLTKVKMVKTLSIISIVCGLLFFLMVPLFIGIVLAIIALVLGDKAQRFYLTENPDPSTWNDSPTLLKAMVYASIGFVINAFVIVSLISIGMAHTNL